MATTSPDNIYYPTTATAVSPLATQFSTLAASVQTALNAIKTTASGQNTRLTTAEAKLAKLPASAIAGSVYIPVNAANTNYSATVTFPAGRFTSAPQIALGNRTGSGTTNLDFQYWATAITTSSFQIWVRRGNTTDCTLSWIAMQ